MAQHLEASSHVLFAGTAREHAGEEAPPDCRMWNWHPIEGDVKDIVDDALAASREAEAGLLAGLIR